MDVEGLKVTLRKIRAHGHPVVEDVKFWTLLSSLKNQMTWKDKLEKSQARPPTPASPFHTHLGI